MSEKFDDEFGEIEPVDADFGEEEAVSAEPEEPKKVERDKSEIAALEWQAKTGRRDHAGEYAFAKAAPFAGSDFEAKQVEKLGRMKDFIDGKPRLGSIVDEKGNTITPEDAALGEAMFGGGGGFDAELMKKMTDHQVAKDAGFGNPYGTDLAGENPVGRHAKHSKAKEKSALERISAMKPLDRMYMQEASELTGQMMIPPEEGESSSDYRKRLKSLVEASFKDHVAAQEEARKKLEETDKTWTDKIVVDGLGSVGYAGELAVGGVFSKGASATKWGFGLTKEGLSRLFSKEGAKQFAKVAGKKAVENAKSTATNVATLHQAKNKYGELTQDEYALDGNGDVVVAHEGDEEGVGTAAKALGGTFVENFLEGYVGELTRPASKVVFRQIGRVPKVGKFIERAYNNYQRATEVTKFGDVLFEELPEENVQYFFSDVLGWGKKGSEYEGLCNELNDALGRTRKKDANGNYVKDKDGNYVYEDGVLHGMLAGEGQFTLKGQWNTALAMVMQMGLQSAYAGGKTAIEHIDAKRDIGNQLEGICGLTKDQVKGMSLEQREAFKNLWNSLADNPQALQEALEKAGGFIGEHADELTKQSTYRLEEDVKGYGETPTKFKIQTEKNAAGRDVPKLVDMTVKNRITGEDEDVRVMRDEEAGVTIIDRGGSYDVINDNDMYAAPVGVDNLTRAVSTANVFALMNQKRTLDNQRKREYAQRLLETKYKRPAIVADTVQDVYEGFANAINSEGEFCGVSNLEQIFVFDSDGTPYLKGGIHSGGFTCPDGTVAVVLDNVQGPADMNRILSHESGHASKLGKGEDAVKERAAFLEKAAKSKKSEYGKMVAEKMQINKDRGLGYTDEQIREEAFSKWLEKRGHNPSLLQKISAKLGDMVGEVGDAELEVLANKIEKESENGSGGDIVFLSGREEKAEETAAPEATEEEFGDEERNDDLPPENVDEPEGPLPTTEAPVETPKEEPKSAPAETPKKPVSERTLVEKLTDKTPAQEVAVDELKVNYKIPQFKGNANPDTGVVDSDRLTGEPFDLVSNPIVVFEHADGTKEVATGRHRYDLYKRAGRKTIPARVIKESDGYTVHDAMTIDAIGNIIDEKGSENDYVKYFNEAKPTRAEAESAGLLDREKGRRAFGIYEGATEATSAVIDWEGNGEEGKISVDQAATIAAAAPKDAHPRFGAVQKILVGKALNGLRGKKLGVLARSLAEETKNRKDTPKVGGEMQLDLFTSEEDQNLLALEDKRADYRVRKAGEYNRIANILQTAITKGGKLELTGDYASELGITDPKNRKQLVAAREKAVERANYWENAVRLEDADKAAMDEEIGAKQKAIEQKKADLVAKKMAKPEAPKVPDSEKISREPKKVTIQRPKSVLEKPKSVPKTELTEQEKDRSAANAAFSALTGIPVVQVGANGEILSDSTPAAEAAIKGAKTPEKKAEPAPAADVIKFPERTTEAQKKVVNEAAKNHPGLSENLNDAWVSSGTVTDGQLVVEFTGTDGKKRVLRVKKDGYTDGVQSVPFFQGKKKEPAAPKKSAKAFTLDPRFRMKNAKEEAEARALEEELGVLFDDKNLDGKIQFDLIKNGKVVGTFYSYDQDKANYHAAMRHGTAVPHGAKKNAIIDPNEARRLSILGRIRRGDSNEVGTLGVQFVDAIKAGILDGGTIAEVRRSLDKADSGWSERREGLVVGDAGLVAHFGSERYYDNGKVAVDIARASGYRQYDADRALRKVMVNNFAFDNVKNITFCASREGSVVAVLDMQPIVGIAHPGIGDVEKFLGDNGFIGADIYGVRLWKKGALNVSPGDLRFGVDADGELVPLVNNSIGSPFDVPVMFDTEDIDMELELKRIGAVMKLVNKYKSSGAANFETMANRLREALPDKFDSMKPLLADIWNVVAGRLNLDRVSQDEANGIYGKIVDNEEKNDGEARITGQTDGGLLDGSRTQDGARAAEGGPTGGSSDRNRNARHEHGVLDGGERHAEGVPVVGHDVERSAGRVSDEHGTGGQGNTQDGDNAPQNARAVAGGGSVETQERVSGLDSGEQHGVREYGAEGGETRSSLQDEERGRGSGGSQAGGRVRRSLLSDQKLSGAAEAAHAASPEKPSNYVITAEDEAWLNTSSPSEKVANNMAVIKLLASLSEDGRTPTPEERTMMARYVGFGGFPQIVDQKYKDAYKTYGDIPSSELPAQTQAALKKLRFGLKGFDIYREMRQYLTQDEFDAIRQAMINAFYTPIDVCRSMHNALKSSGFNGGRMLETSAGTGNMVGTGVYDSVPRWTAIELDKTTGKILEYLYPEANVKIQGFQDVIIPKNFIDATISNVPFSNDIHPYDSEYAKYGFNLHDYFFAKTVDTLRPGGVAALISSTGTLDKTDKSLLRFMDENGGQIVGAVRLPNGHQQKNSGTEVAADIIFIQKVNGRADNSAFMKNGELFGIKINDYFVRNPGMIFGTAEAGRSMYGNAPALKFKATREPSELDATIRKAAEGLKYLAPNETPVEKPLDLDANKTGLNRGNIGIVNGKLVKREGDVVVQLDVERMTKSRPGKDGKMHRPIWPEGMTKKGHTLVKAVEDMVNLRKAYHEYVDAQKNGDDETVRIKRVALNAIYDVMQSKYGHFNDGVLEKVFDLDDADGIILQNLEAFDLVDTNKKSKSGKPIFKKQKFRKSDTLLKRTLFLASKAAKADNVLDGLRISLNENGGVNLSRIAELTGKTKEEVSDELMKSGHVFQNPSTGGLETRDEYLSGAVRRKLREARAAADVDPAFKKNVEELEKVQPEDKPATKIKYQLGQKFIPNGMYQSFLSERIFGTPENPAKRVAVGYDEKKDTWLVSGDGVNPFWARKCPDGTNLEDILVRIFNGSSLTIKDRVDDGGGKYHYVPNAQKTQAVEALRDDLTAELSKWMVATPERAKQIERAYNDKMNDNVERKFDTSLLSLDGISDLWLGRVNTPGYEHQKRSITRGVFGGNLYIQHCVGAGKSFEMFSICMQLRRLGLARKPMLTVPNHMVESGQVLREFKEAYPGANILVATTKDLNSTNRRKFLAKAANGDWDCVVVPHSSFSLIGMDPKVQAEYIRQEIEELREMLESDDEPGKKKRGNQEKRIEKKIASKTEKMKRLLDQSKKDSTVPFENIGVDYLFVDEAHNFKGLDITTKMSNVSGVTGSVSQRAQDLEMKCRYLAKLHGEDKGVVFASGTPISNSISESYTNMRFMNPTQMRDMGVYRFDDWAKSFGVVETKAAPRASGKGYQEKTRFARFQNLVELKQANFAYADIVLDSDLNISRPFMAGIGDDGKPVLGKPIVHKIPATDFQKKYVEQLDKRLDSFKGKFDPKIDNPLKVVTEGRLLAIDPALLGLKDEHRRLETIADNVFRIWQKSTGIVGKDKETVLDGTQLIFCDSGVPKPKKFSKVVRTADGGFATKAGNYWTLYVSDVDANGMRHGKAVRSDGATFSPRPFADHSQNGMEDISSVYAAFDEMAQMASEYGKAGKNEKGLGLKEYQKSNGYKVDEPKKHLTHAKEPEGELFDINAWLDENAETVGYDVRFENPYSSERGEMADYEEADEAQEEEISEEEDEDAPEKDQDEANNGDVAVENMLRGKFNIYAYLKNALVKRGVPADEIAFIHDAEDAKAKRALFEKFNAEDTNFRGGPRILIGNTPKMGEGANVQKRLVAIHHADIPWKPAWLIQRDGRGIRAGNLNESIGIHRYVTENTFDVYSYDKVSGKQQFINQVQSHDMSQDEVEDVDDAVLAAEEAKAAAAGPIGKYMMAKTKLEQGIRKAELTLANQQSDIFNAQSGLEWDGQKLQAATRLLEDTKEMLDRFASAKGDKPFGIEVTDKSFPEFGETITDNDKLQQFLMKKVNEFVMKGVEDGIVGKLYGMNVWWNEIHSSNVNDQRGRISIREIGMTSPEIPIINRIAPISKSTVSMLKSAVTQATSEKVLARARANVENAKKAFEASKAAIAKIKVDETLPAKIEDMKVELATTLNILGAKDERVQNEARSILNTRIEEGRNAEAAALALAEINKPLPIERQLADLERESAEVEFDTTELNDDPSAEEVRKISKAAFKKRRIELGKMPRKEFRMSWDEVYSRAEAIMSAGDAMDKIIHDAAQHKFSFTPEQTIAAGKILWLRSNAYEECVQYRKEAEGLLQESPDDDELKAIVREARMAEDRARQAYEECDTAMANSKEVQGRALAANKAQFTLAFDFLGIKRARERARGDVKLTPEEAEQLRDVCDLARNLEDAKQRELYDFLKKAARERIDSWTKHRRKEVAVNPDKEMKKAFDKYNEAMNHLLVWSMNGHDTLFGISGDEYTNWSKPLFDILAYIHMTNPSATSEEALARLTDEVRVYVPDADENSVARILTGFEKTWDPNHGSENLAGTRDWKTQIRLDLQRELLERGIIPGRTGAMPTPMSDEARRKQAWNRGLLNEIQKSTNDPTKLKTRIDSLIKKYTNMIRDVQEEIANRELLKQSKPAAVSDPRLDALKDYYKQLLAERDAIPEIAALNEQKALKRIEDGLMKSLRYATDRLVRAMNDDFRGPKKKEGPTNEFIESMRKEIKAINDEYREVRRERLIRGMTQEQINKYNQRREEKLNERLVYWQSLTEKDADRSIKKLPPIPMTKEQQKRVDKINRQLDKLKQRVRQMRADDALRDMPRLVRNSAEYWNFAAAGTRSLLATYDFSAMMRQMAQLTVSHPILAKTAAAKAFSAMKSPADAQRINDALLDDPVIAEAVEKKWLKWRNIESDGTADDVEMFSNFDTAAITLPGGKRLALGDINVNLFSTKVGGAIVDGTIGKIPYVGHALAEIAKMGTADKMKAFERHYATYINALSAEMYKAMVGGGTFTARLVFGQNDMTDWTKRELAARINIANGSTNYGTDGSGHSTSEIVEGISKSGIFWAPKLAISRLSLAVWRDVWRPFVAGKKVNGKEVGLGVKDRARVAAVNLVEHMKAKAAMLALGMLVKMLLSDDDDKERSKRKAKSLTEWFYKMLNTESVDIGDTRIDFSGGERSAEEFLWKMLAGYRMRRDGKVVALRNHGDEKVSFNESQGKEMWRYLFGKGNPHLTNMWNILNGKNEITGEEFHTWDAVKNAMFPLGIQDVVSSYAANGAFKGTVAAPLILAGAGGNTYERHREDTLISMFKNDLKEYEGYMSDNMLDSATRKALLENIESTNKLMSRENRRVIGNKIRDVEAFKRMAKKEEKERGAVSERTAERLRKATEEAVKLIRERR